MTIEMTCKALLWCAVINYGILLVWFLFFVLAHDRMYLLHSRWFRLSVEQFDMLHYAGMSIFKIGILLLNLGSLHRPPYHASRIGLFRDLPACDCHCSRRPALLRQAKANTTPEIAGKRRSGY